MVGGVTDSPEERKKLLRARGISAFVAFVLLLLDMVFLFPISFLAGILGIVLSVVVSSMVGERCLRHLKKSDS